MRAFRAYRNTGLPITLEDPFLAWSTGRVAGRVPVCPPSRWRPWNLDLYTAGRPRAPGVKADHDRAGATPAAPPPSSDQEVSLESTVTKTSPPPSGSRGCWVACGRGWRGADELAIPDRADEPPPPPPASAFGRGRGGVQQVLRPGRGVEHGWGRRLYLRRVHIGSPNHQVSKYPGCPTSPGFRRQWKRPHDYKVLERCRLGQCRHRASAPTRGKTASGAGERNTQRCHPYAEKSVKPRTSRNLCSSQALPPGNTWLLASESLASAHLSGASR